MNMTSQNQKPVARSGRFKSIDKGDKVYVMCDEGILVDICTILKRSGFGLSNVRGYDPFKDKVRYDWYLLFNQGIGFDNSDNFIRLSEEMELYDERMKETLISITLFREKQKWNT